MMAMTTTTSGAMMSAMDLARMTGAATAEINADAEAARGQGRSQRRRRRRRVRTAVGTIELEENEKEKQRARRLVPRAARDSNAINVPRGDRAGVALARAPLKGAPGGNQLFHRAGQTDERHDHYDECHGRGRGRRGGQEKTTLQR